MHRRALGNANRQAGIKRHAAQGCQDGRNAHHRHQDAVQQAAQSTHAHTHQQRQQDIQPHRAGCHPAGHQLEHGQARQDGRQVFKAAVTSMAEVAQEIMNRTNLKAEDVDYLVPHPANQRIIDATAERMGGACVGVRRPRRRFGSPQCVMSDYASERGIPWVSRCSSSQR